MQPERPPFPLLRNLPVQFEGSQASRVMLLLEDVLTSMATRQTSERMIWLEEDPWDSMHDCGCESRSVSDRGTFTMISL